MLRRDMLITLHLRIRVIATHEIKLRVRLAREHRRREHQIRAREAMEGSFMSSASGGSEFEPEKNGMLFARRSQSGEDEEGDGEEDEEGGIGDDSGWETGDDDSLWPSVIPDPSRATPRQRRWLTAMSEGKDPQIARRFEQCVFWFPNFGVLCMDS
jgi:nitrogen permease regulator 3-like protein